MTTEGLREDDSRHQAIALLTARAGLTFLLSFHHQDYSTIIFSQNGLSSNTSAILGAVLNTLFWIGTICAIPLIDRVGRRGLMLYTAIVCTILMAVFASLLSIPNPTNTTNWVASALIIVYLGVFGLGWIGKWTIPARLQPLWLY